MKSLSGAYVRFKLFLKTCPDQRPRIGRGWTKPLGSHGGAGTESKAVSRCCNYLQGSEATAVRRGELHANTPQIDRPAEISVKQSVCDALCDASHVRLGMKRYRCV